MNLSCHQFAKSMPVFILGTGPERTYNNWNKDEDFLCNSCLWFDSYQRPSDTFFITIVLENFYFFVSRERQTEWQRQMCVTNKIFLTLYTHMNSLARTHLEVYATSKNKRTIYSNAVIINSNLYRTSNLIEILAHSQQHSEWSVSTQRAKTSRCPSSYLK